MCCRFSALLSDTVHHARFDTSKQVVDIYIYALDVKAIKACHLLGSGYQLARGHNFEIFNNRYYQGEAEGDTNEDLPQCNNVGNSRPIYIGALMEIESLYQ